MKTKKIISILLIFLLIGSILTGCTGSKYSEEDYLNDVTETCNAVTDNFLDINEILTSDDPVSSENTTEMLELLSLAKENCTKLKSLDAPSKYTEAQDLLNQSCDKFIEAFDLMEAAFKDTSSSSFSSNLMSASTLLTDGASLMNEAGQKFEQ